MRVRRCHLYREVESGGMSPVMRHGSSMTAVMGLSTMGPDEFKHLSLIHI